MTSITRLQLRAARALLALQQEALAHKADVGVASLRRFENGNEVGKGVVEALLMELERQGAILIPPGTVVDGREVGGGVVLDRWEALPAETRQRLDRVNLTSEKAAEEIPEMKRGRVGRRTRSPVSEDARGKQGTGVRRGSRRKGLDPPKA